MNLADRNKIRNSKDSQSFKDCTEDTDYEERIRKEQLSMEMHQQTLELVIEKCQKDGETDLDIKVKTNLKRSILGCKDNISYYERKLKRRQKAEERKLNEEEKKLSLSDRQEEGEGSQNSSGFGGDYDSKVGESSKNPWISRQQVPLQVARDNYIPVVGQLNVGKTRAPYSVNENINEQATGPIEQVKSNEELQKKETEDASEEHEDNVGASQNEDHSQ